MKGQAEGSGMTLPLCRVVVKATFWSKVYRSYLTSKRVTMKRYQCHKIRLFSHLFVVDSHVWTYIIPAASVDFR